MIRECPDCTKLHEMVDLYRRWWELVSEERYTLSKVSIGIGAAAAKAGVGGWEHLHPVDLFEVVVRQRDEAQRKVTAPESIAANLRETIDHLSAGIRAERDMRKQAERESERLRERLRLSQSCTRTGVECRDELRAKLARLRPVVDAAREVDNLAWGFDNPLATAPDADMTLNAEQLLGLHRALCALDAQDSGGGSGGRRANQASGPSPPTSPASPETLRLTREGAILQAATGVLEWFDGKWQTDGNVAMNDLRAALAAEPQPASEGVCARCGAVGDHYCLCHQCQDASSDKTEPADD